MPTLDISIGDQIEDKSLVTTRISIRCIVKKKDKYLMHKADKWGCLFPGGGVEDGEIEKGCKPVWLTKEEIIQVNNACQAAHGMRDVWCEMVEMVLEVVE